MTEEEEFKRAFEKTVKEPLRHFEIKLEIRRIKNILSFIPSLYIFTGNKLCLDFNFKWLFIYFQVWIEWDMRKKKNFNGIFVIPLFVLYHLDKEYKEKFDFQFYWFNIGIRKFFGERKVYEISIKDKEFKRF